MLIRKAVSSFSELQTEADASTKTRTSFPTFAGTSEPSQPSSSSACSPGLSPSTWSSSSGGSTARVALKFRLLSRPETLRKRKTPSEQTLITITTRQRCRLFNLVELAGPSTLQTDLLRSHHQRAMAITLRLQRRTLSMIHRLTLILVRLSSLSFIKAKLSRRRPNQGRATNDRVRSHTTATPSAPLPTLTSNETP